MFVGQSVRILEIAVPVPLRRSFEYLLPNSLEPNSSPEPGIRIQVPFGGRQLIGILLGTVLTSTFDMQKLKPVTKILDRQPLFDAKLFDLCLWAASYYQHPIGEVLHGAMPVLLRRGEPATQPIDYLIETSANSQPNLSRSPKQASLFEALQRHPAGMTRGEVTELGISPGVIKGLVNKQLAQWLTRDKPIKPFDYTRILAEDRLPLTDEQAAALKQVSGAETHLLFGITGSGKTEIYLQLIEQKLTQGKQALVLVPEIGLTPQTVRRFRQRFHTKVVVLHSGLTDRERLYAFRQSKLGAAGIVIGTRSAIFTPLKHPGIIVVDEEHDVSFKQQKGFRYSARDLAVYRGRMERIPVILGTATPALESYQNALSGKYLISRLNLRPTKAGTAAYKIIGIQNQPLVSGFSKPLIHLIQQHLNDGNQVLVFLNRRGFSPVILCRVCGWIAECKQCDARLTYHLTQSKLICHHCGYQIRVAQQCSACQSEQLVPLGAGTQRLENTLHSLYPGQQIIRIDRDSTRNKGAMEAIIKTIHKGQPALLVGTQLLAKGHHFPNVTLVAVVDIDTGFYSADYRAIERMGQLLLQVAGRAGRATKPGTVAIQTHFPHQPVLRTLLYKGYEAFAKQLLAERSTLELPPFSHQAVIRAEAKTTHQAMQFLTEIRASTDPSPGTSILGPIPAPMVRRSGRYRAQLLLAGKNRHALQASLKRCIRCADQSPAAKKLRWSADVDPVDLF